MRQLSSHYVATYSHNDDEVKFLLKFSVFTGCIVGGVIVGMLMSAFN